MPGSGSPTSDRDDLGVPVVLPGGVSRVVSLVPSLTESIAETAPELLVGATDWCSYPPDLDLARVRGTKNPDVERILALRPDVVVANEEENRPEDVHRLRASGVAVWVTAPTTVPGALTSLARMLHALGLGRPLWLAEAEAAWRDLAPGAPRRRALVPIWRRPWMALGRDTFAGDVLRRLGVDNVLAGAADRYPRFEPARVPALDLVVLPDEPYAFSFTDGPEVFPGTPAACVSGRRLTWYGPSLRAAPAVLAAQLADTR